MNVQNKALQRDLNHSEAARMEAERKAALAAAEVTRLADVAIQVEEAQSESKSLTNQVFGSFMRGTSKPKVYFSSSWCLRLSSVGEGTLRQTVQPGE